VFWLHFACVFPVDETVVWRDQILHLLQVPQALQAFIHFFPGYILPGFELFLKTMGNKCFYTAVAHFFDVGFAMGFFASLPDQQEAQGQDYQTGSGDSNHQRSPQAAGQGKSGSGADVADCRAGG